MTDSLTKYFALMEKFPSLFANPPGEDVIELISDRAELSQHQQRIRAALREEGRPESFIDLGVLVDDPWYYVVRDLVRFPNGYVGGYIRFLNRKTLEGGTSVVILPVQAGKIVLISHFRHDTRRRHWELPAGFGEPDLNSRQNALKELEEEVGLVPTSLSLMSTENESEDWRFSYYYAELDPTQEIHVELAEGIGSFALLTPTEYEQWVRDGKITDPNAIKAYLIGITGGFLTRN